MKTVTSGFKTNIKTLGRQIENKVSFYTSLAGYNIITEGGDYITTESGDLLETEKGWYVLENTNLNSIETFFNGDIMKSVMKGIELDSLVSIPDCMIVNYQFGVLVGSSYEYIDYGNYFVKSCEYQADTNSYKIIAYDKMLYSMVDVDDTFIQGLTYPITVKNYLTAICTELGLTLATSTFVNDDVEIATDIHSGIGYTYRDILDEIAQVTGSIICINDDDEVEVRYPTETSETIDEHSLSSINVKMGEKYGVINSIVFSRSNDTDTIYERDDGSIALNGLTELKIKDNQILSTNDRIDFMSELFDYLNGFYYYNYDVESTGITYLELGDIFNFSINGETYKTLLLNDNLKVSSGLKEDLYLDIPKVDESNYKTSALTDKQNKIATIEVNKQKAEILLKVSADQIISSINLSPEAITINSGKLNLTGLVTITQLGTAGATTINGENVTTGSLKSANYVANTSGTKINLNDGTIDTKNFKVDSTGSATMSSATLTDGILKIGTTEIFNTSGTLTVFQYPSAGGNTPLGWYYDGAYHSMATDIAYTIPSNFTIVSAYVSLYHIPCYHSINESGTINYYWGYSRNNKLYKKTQTGFYLEVNSYMIPYYADLTASEVYQNATSTNAFGSSGWTASVADATTHNAETTYSSDISTRLTAGETGTLIIKTTDSTPSTVGSSLTKTGQGFATLIVIGYYKI